jgi:hypothetical protein
MNFFYKLPIALIGAVAIIAIAPKILQGAIVQTYTTTSTFTRSS